MPWTRAEQPCPITRSITTCISPAALGLLFGIPVSIFTEHRVLGEQNSSVSTKLKDSCLFSAQICHCSFLPFSTMLPLSFLLERKIPQWYLMFFSKLILPTGLYQQPLAAWNYRKIQTLPSRLKAFPPPPQQNSPAHITRYLHTSFCCPLSHLGQISNQVEGVVMSCSQLEVILTYLLQCRHIIDWSPGSAVALEGMVIL